MIRTPDECGPVYTVRLVRLLTGGVQVSQFVPGFGRPRVMKCERVKAVDTRRIEPQCHPLVLSCAWELPSFVMYSCIVSWT